MPNRAPKDPAVALALGAFAHLLKSSGLSADDIGRRSAATPRCARNWREGVTGPQFHNVTVMLGDPVMRLLVLKAASAVAEGSATELAGSQQAPSNESNRHVESTPPGRPADG